MWAIVTNAGIVLIQDLPASLPEKWLTLQRPAASKSLRLAEQGIFLRVGLGFFLILANLKAGCVGAVVVARVTGVTKCMVTRL